MNIENMIAAKAEINISHHGEILKTNENNTPKSEAKNNTNSIEHNRFPIHINLALVIITIILIKNVTQKVTMMA